MIEKILAAVKFVWVTLVYIVYPPLCPICKEIVDEDGQICDSCATKLYPLDTAKIFPDVLDGVMRITRYRGGTRSILRKLKFDNDLNALPELQKILGDVSNRPEIKNFIKGIDAAAFVPLHQKRLKERGYNQTELLFRDWLVAQGLTAANLLIRIKATPKLYNLNRTERQEALNGAFDLAKGADVRGKNILIVDDIYTTGATAAGCAHVLKAAGAAKIFMLAFASDFGENNNA